MKKYLIALLLISTAVTGFSQEDICNCPQQTKIGKGTLYFSWGYNREVFSKSDIHFKNTSNTFNQTKGYNESYDFTVYDVVAKDRPGFKDMLRTDLTIPQYNYRLGYFFNNKNDLGIEINFDHTKYIMQDWQTLHVKGTIHGQYIDQDTLIDPTNFLAFEHSDGANFLMLNIMKRKKLLVTKNKKHWISGIAKFGAGPVIPRTQITLFGEQINNRFHIAGYCVGAEIGLRYDFFKYIYLEYTGKGVFSDYRNVLVIGDGKARHHFWTAETILVLGLQIPI